MGYKETKTNGNNIGVIEFRKTITKKADGGWTIYGGDGDPNDAIVSVDFIDNCIYNTSDTTYYCFEAG